MSTTTITAAGRALAHQHGLDRIAGYLLRRTDVDGTVNYLAAWKGDTCYGQALGACHRLFMRRRQILQADPEAPKALYRVVTVYTCGCTSDDGTTGLMLLDYAIAEEQADRTDLQLDADRTHQAAVLTDDLRKGLRGMLALETDEALRWTYKDDLAAADRAYRDDAARADNAARRLLAHLQTSR